MSSHGEFVEHGGRRKEPPTPGAYATPLTLLRSLPSTPRGLRTVKGPSSTRSHTLSTRSTTSSPITPVRLHACPSLRPRRTTCTSTSHQKTCPSAVAVLRRPPCLLRSGKRRDSFYPQDVNELSGSSRALCITVCLRVPIFKVVFQLSSAPASEPLMEHMDGVR